MINTPSKLIDAVAELLLPEMQRFYESIEGRTFFVEWEKEKLKNDGNWQSKTECYACVVNFYIADRKPLTSI